ncbi:MAG: hypothetical protein JSS66_01790 [Armatimonadetes bacterium]|nr:hypothetical protein [Armatimonadota bacterium]
MILASLCLAMAAQPVDLSAAYTVPQTVRLAITPVLDGKISPEEWDSLSNSGGCDAYFQWEPETLYFAANAKDGEDVVVSLDMKSDGWLVGDDNLELRIGFKDGQPALSTRKLDSTDPAGPAWKESGILHESIKLMGTKTDSGWSFEASFTPPANQTPNVGTKLGLRIDAVPAGSDLGGAFLPRGMSFVNLQFDLGQNLPSGFSWRPDFLVRSVPVDDSFKVKYGFKRSENVEFSHVEYRAEGYAKDLMATGTKPFPSWDKKGKAGEQYATIIASGAPVGYRVLRLSLKGKDGAETTLRSSFRIADLVEYDVHLPRSLPLDPDARIIRGSVDIRSNGLKRINGNFKFHLPSEWTATRGKETKFTIYHSRGVAKVPLEFIVPKDTVGVFPLTFVGEIGDKVVSKTMYVPVGQP